MERLHLGVVPDSALDSEAKLLAWVKSKKSDMRSLHPHEIVLSVTQTYGKDRTTRKTVTVAEILCDDQPAETFVTYHPTSKEAD